MAGPATVSPGRHAFTDHGYSVVWWDPNALELGARPPFGVRREELIVKDVPRHVVADGRSRYDRWRQARDDARASGAVPSLAVETVRAWVASDDRPRSSSLPSASEVAVVDVLAGGAPSTARDRPGGAAFGALVHAILEQTPLDATRSTLDDVAAVAGRLIGASEADVKVAADTVARVLAHDLLVKARMASGRGACRRETPVTCVMADGTLIEGVVDVAFEENGVWTVIDYKTDRDLARRGEELYRRQVALYASAIAQATGQRAIGVLVRL
jgi:ATP-dependent exoDNAse (exonuclease V) beta subunit